MRITTAALMIFAMTHDAPIFAQDAKVCEYAMTNTKRLIPDLCEILDSNRTLHSLWEKASKSGQSRIIPGVLLAGGAIIFGALAMANASSNTERCPSSILEGNDCRDGDPVLPLMAVSGVFAISDILFLSRPNSSLEAAINATRKFRNEESPINPEANPAGSDSLEVGTPLETNCEDLHDRVLLFECNRKKRVKPEGK
jgi:hypothetical protein